MELARFVVDAVVLEGRSCRDVARSHGVSKSWVAERVARYRAGGYDALTPCSKAAKTIANKTSAELEDRVVRLRKELVDGGFDAGAQTIHYHLGLTDPSPPSLSTIWRILKRRGFVAPQPHKRPKSSYIRFEAALPDEMWQQSMTRNASRFRARQSDPQLGVVFTRSGRPPLEAFPSLPSRSSGSGFCPQVLVRVSGPEKGRVAQAASSRVLPNWTVGARPAPAIRLALRALV